LLDRMASALSYYCALAVLLACTSHCHSNSFEAEWSQYDDSLEAEKREVEEFEEDKRDLEEFEAEKRESEEFEAEKRELEGLKIKKSFIFGCDDIWKCPKGQRKRSSGYSDPPNGCGTKGLDVDGLLEKDCPFLIRCCNAHDECYSRYGASRNSCDRHMADCNARAPTADCRKRGKWLSNIVSTRLGCIGFNAAQKAASICE